MKFFIKLEVLTKGSARGERGKRVLQPSYLCPCCEILDDSLSTRSFLLPAIYSPPVRSCDHCVVFKELLNPTTKATPTNVGERKLFGDLFSNYVPEVRPRIDPTQNVDVTVDLDLNHIKHLVRHFERHLPPGQPVYLCRIQIKIIYR